MTVTASATAWYGDGKFVYPDNNSTNHIHDIGRRSMILFSLLRAHNIAVRVPVDSQ